MTGTGVTKSGRRREDLALRGQRPRERRKPPAQTHAAAQSVVMARLSEPSAPDPQIPTADAAKLYAQIKPQKSAEDIRKEAFLRDAELKQQAAQRAWAFERRRGNKPRTIDIEHAEIL